MGGLLPWVEDDFFPGVIWVQRGDNTLDRIVKENRADTDFPAKLKVVMRAKEWLILTNGLAFVVINRPAASNPTQIRCSIYNGDIPRNIFDFHLAPEEVKRIEGLVVR